MIFILVNMRVSFLVCTMKTYPPTMIPARDRGIRRKGRTRAKSLVTRKGCVQVCLMALVLLGALHLFCSVPQAGDQKPLRQTGVRENPHFRKDRCDACHPPGNPRMLLHADADELCLSCHKDEKNRVEIHPSGVSARKGEVRKIPSDFPLVNKKLGCITCHDHLVPCRWDTSLGIADPLFLRGGPYMKPWEICFRCHEHTLYQVFYLHDQMEDNGTILEETCIYCHQPPAPGSEQSIVGDPLEPNCVSCHRIVHHPAGTNHLRKPTRKVQKNLQRVSRQNNLYFPLTSRGEIYCGTCHNPHEKGVLKAQTPASLGSEGDQPRNQRLRALSEEICLVCHGFRPYKGESSSKER